MKLKAALLFCSYLLTFTTVVHAKLSDWHEYSSENFKIYSDEKPAKVKKTLTDFEKFRTATLSFTGFKDRPENSRMIILLYADRSEYLKLNPGKNVGGFYLNTWAGPRMVVGPGVRSLDSSVILFHEYVHHLMREHTNLIYPKWYDEGLAELLGSATIKDNDVIVGSLNPLRRGWLEHVEILPVRYLLAPRNADSESSYWGRFYAASWIFTHYLQMGHLDGKPDYRQASRNLIMRIHKGDDAETAFTEEFGMSTRSMDRELLRYMKRGSLIAVKLSVGKYKGEINTRKLPTNEIRYILGDMAAQRGEDETALNYLQGIDDTQADSARALAQLAVLQNHNQIASAEAHLLKALAYAPDNDEVLTNAAHFYWDVYDTTEDKNLREKVFEKIKHYGEKSVSINPFNIEVQYYLWSAYRAQGERINALQSMMTAYDAHSTNIALNYILGTYLYEGPSKHLARDFLTRVLAWSHDEEQLARAQEILDELDKIAASQAATATTENTN